MRKWLLILYSWVLATPLALQAQSGAIDAMLDRAVHHVRLYDDSTLAYAEQALAASRQSDYTHGIALALACKAAHTEYKENDFVAAETQARESLEWFEHTPDKRHSTLAWFTLSFAVFAQSRFQESISYLRQADSLARQDKDTIGMINSLSLTGCSYRESGDYEHAFEIFRRCIQMAETYGDLPLLESQYFELAALYIQIEDYPSATKAFHLGFALRQPMKCTPWTTMVYAQLLSLQHQFDSAAKYFDSFDSAGAPPATFRTFLVGKGEFLMQQDRPKEALPYFEKSLLYQRQFNDRNQLMRCLKDLALTFQQLGHDSLAFRYARESLNIATQYGARQYIRDNCGIIHNLFERQHRIDSAYAYYRRYIVMKDVVNNEQLKGKFASYAFEQKIAFLSKEKQLQDVCIREQMMTKRFLIGGIVALLLTGFIFSRYIMLKRKNEAHLRQRAETQLAIQRLEGEKTKAALQQRAKELEVQALRSQMNPHFIFNCLNAINRFILSHETEAAADYLTKFSRLMRMTMNHSRHAQITLAEELEMLELYLDMEKLRFKNAFDHSIIIEDDIDPSEIMIPPLLMQPFVENAVWHGLMHKKERGHLSIIIGASGNTLRCIIRDNGIGRQKAGQLKSKSAEKHKSMGLQITAERLALLADQDGPEHFFTIEDLHDAEGNPAGTQVILTIRVNITQYSV